MMWPWQGSLIIRLSRYLNPSLTAVCQPTLAIGQNAAELLIELIESKKAEEKYTTIKLKQHLTSRIYYSRRPLVPTPA